MALLVSLVCALWLCQWRLGSCARSVDRAEDLALVAGHEEVGVDGGQGSVALYFNLKHAETQFGEQVRVTGELPELGTWDPAGGLGCTTDADTYPAWQSRVVWVQVAASGPTEVSYKYVKDRRTLRDDFAWEDAIENRKFTIPARAREVVVTDEGFNVVAGPDVAVSKTVSLALSLEAASEPTASKQTSAPKAKAPSKEVRLLGMGSYGSVVLLRFTCGDMPWHAAMKKAEADPQTTGSGAEFSLQRLAMKGNPFSVAMLQGYHVPKARFEYGLVEYMEGGDLTKIVDETWIHGMALVDDGKLLRVIFTQLVRGTMLMHQNGVVHRDLKPPNLLVNKAVCTSSRVKTAEDWIQQGCSLKIADFGLGCTLDADSTASCSGAPAAGTANYVSPEQLNDVTASPTMDVWALGIILYELLFARYPYQDDVSMEHTGWMLRGLKQLFASDRSFRHFHRKPKKKRFQNYHDDGASDVLKMTLRLNKPMVGEDAGTEQARATIEEVWDSDYVRLYRDDVLRLEREELKSPARSAPECVTAVGPEETTTQV